MKSSKIEYASDAEQEGWKHIDWVKANHTVKLLQSRIVKAWKEGKHRKAKSLQWIIRIRFCTYLRERRKRQIPIGSF